VIAQHAVVRITLDGIIDGLSQHVNRKIRTVKGESYMPRLDNRQHGRERTQGPQKKTSQGKAAEKGPQKRRNTKPFNSRANHELYHPFLGSSYFCAFVFLWPSLKVFSFAASVSFCGHLGTAW
jgi:hypothetical protein